MRLRGIWGWVIVKVESIWGWVPAGIESIRGVGSQSGLSPFGVESIRDWVLLGLSPFRVESLRGWVYGWVHSGLDPLGVESLWGRVHWWLRSFRVAFIRGWVFLGSVILGSAVLGSVGELLNFECLWLHPQGDPASPLSIKRTILSEWTLAWWLFLSCFWLHSRGTASPSDYLKNHLIWVDSIQIVPLGLHVEFSLSSPWDSFLGRSLRIHIYCTPLIFSSITDYISCFINDFRLFFDYCHCYCLILEMCSRYFDP